MAIAEQGGHKVAHVSRTSYPIVTISSIS